MGRNLRKSDPDWSTIRRRVGHRGSGQLARLRWPRSDRDGVWWAWYV